MTWTDPAASEPGGAGRLPAVAAPAEVEASGAPTSPDPTSRAHGRRRADGPVDGPQGPVWRSAPLAAWRRPRQQWAVAAVLVLLAAVLRMWNLGAPTELVFDETYYVKDGWTLVNLGYEAEWIEVPVEGEEEPSQDVLFEAGDVTAYDPDDPSYIVHPPMGKYVIGLGMRALGADDPVGWRISVALLGIGTVLLTTRAATRLTRSTVLGGLAGLLVAIDGQGIVHSRTSLLDGPLTFFLLAAFAALLVDRDRARARLARRTAAPDAAELWGRWGPSLGWRPWRLVAGVMLAAAVSTKWSALYFVAAWGLLSVGWDLFARHRAGLRWQVGLIRDAVPAFLALVGTTAVGYLASWSGWLRGSGGWGRQWAAEHPGEGVQWLPEGLRSLAHYHRTMWDFHTGLTSEHSYQAHPWGWIIQWRPTSFYYRSPEPEACGAEKCSLAITSLGNPLIWWLGALALVVAVWWVLRRRDGVALAALSGVAAGWLPWFQYAERPIFAFYSVAFLPYLAVVLVWVAGRWWEDAGLVRHPPDVTGPARPAWRDGWRGGVRTARCWVDEDRRTAVRTVITVALVAIVAVSVFFYPLWTGMTVSIRFWQLHMWLPTWV